MKLYIYLILMISSVAAIQINDGISGSSDEGKSGVMGLENQETMDVLRWKSVTWSDKNYNFKGVDFETDQRPLFEISSR